MRPAFAFIGVGALTLLLAGAARVPSPVAPHGKVAVVQVHCPAGNKEAFVTPNKVKISLGDDIEWRMGGQVVTESIQISLKDPDQAWPFDGNPSRGAKTARARGAHTPGTYAYNVTLVCQTADGPQEVVIDPDIIIAE